MGWDLLPPPNTESRELAATAPGEGQGGPGPRCPPGGPAPPGPRRGNLRSAAARAGPAVPGSAAGAGEGRGAPVRGSRGGTERPELSPGPGTGGGALRRGGSRGGRGGPGRSSASRGAAPPLPRRAPACTRSRMRPLRRHSAGPVPAGPGTPWRDSVPSPAPRPRTASDHCVQGTGRCIPSWLISLSALPPLLFQFSYLLFTPLFLAFP